MKLKVKRLFPDAILPTRAKPGDAGLDLYCHRKEAPSTDIHSMLDVCHTGIAVEIPNGHVGLIFPRSSITNTKHRLANSVGVIDSGCRGEISLRFEDTVALPMCGWVVSSVLEQQKKGLAGGNQAMAEEMGDKAERFYGRFKAITAAEYQPGDRIGQLVIVPCMLLEVEEIDALSETERGTGGFGSTN